MQLSCVEEFTVLRDMDQVKSKVGNLNFKKAKFQLFKELVNKTLRETALRKNEKKRAGKPLRMLSIMWKRSKSSHVRR